MCELDPKFTSTQRTRSSKTALSKLCIFSDLNYDFLTEFPSLISYHVKLSVSKGNYIKMRKIYATVSRLTIYEKKKYFL